MIYEVLKPLVRAGLKAYFKRIDIHGKKHLEYKRLVLVSNHPSALFDPLVVAVNSRKPLHFITGAEWFGKGLKNWFFKRQFHMIPVYRPWLEKNKEKDNKDMFRECYISLAKGASIIIYPEAESITVPWIRELKTGAARIKMGGDNYLREHKYDDKVKVVPVGLNYTNPKRVQSRLFIHVGEPVDFSGIDQNQDAKEVARLYTERIKQAMEETVLHVENEEHYPIIKAAIKMLTDAIMDELEVKKDDYISAFFVQKEIVRKIESIKMKEPERLATLEGRMITYVERFESLGFRRFNPFETKKSTRLILWLGVILGAPFYLIGILINGLPFLISIFIFRRLLLEKVTGEHKQGTINPAFAGSLGWSLGLAFFVVWYVLLAITTSMFIPWWIAWPLSWVVGYQSGRFALTYVRWVRRIRRIRRWNKFDRNEPDQSKALLEERSAILTELMRLYKEPY